MTLTKIEKPYGLCTKEEQEGLKGLLSTPDALQHLGVDGRWASLLCWDRGLMPHLTYRQNPSWQPPTLDIPDWFWDKTCFNYVAMDPNQSVFAYHYKPCKSMNRYWLRQEVMARLDEIFTNHNFNPHHVLWDKSLTVRPGLDK